MSSTPSSKASSNAGSRLIVDTMVLSWLSDPRNPRPDWEAITTGKTLYLSFVTVGEILHGAQRWSSRRRDEIERRLSAWPVIPGTIGVARKYAELRGRFFSQIGENDLWIAACALRGPEPIALATEDRAFDRVAQEFGLLIARPDEQFADR
jgi:predicted nucleic acid-binding protein